MSVFGIGGNFNIASFAVEGALAVGTGGTSLAVSTALRGVMSSIGDQVIQTVGKELGLPQAATDLASAAFHAEIGDVQGATSGLQSAVSDLSQATGGTPTEEGQFGQAAQSVADQLTNGMLENAKGDDSKAAQAGGKGESFLVKLAVALGQVLDKKMNDMLDLSNQIGSMGTIDNTNQSQLGELTGKMQALGQETSMLSNALDNTIKSAGEGLSTLARKS